MGSRGAAQRRAQQDVQTARGGSLPSSVGGWNARDPIPNLKTTDAIQLDNFIPRAGYDEIRRGFLSHVTGFVARPESFIPYRSGGSEQNFAASGTAIYDVTAAGPLGAAVVTGLTNARFQSVNFANDAGVFAIAVNGADTPRKYDGTTWSTTAITGSVGAITLDPTTLIDVMVHVRRIFLHEAGTLRVWYLAVDAIAGPAGLLDLGPVFDRGGEVVAMGTWSYDTSAGLQGFAAFATDQGQVAIYTGSDPSDATAWSLIDVFEVGKPLGRRALIKYGADLALITFDGAIPLSKAVNLDRTKSAAAALTAKIENAFAIAARSYSANFGWEAILYPTGQLAIINVPVTSLGISRQYVMNVQTGAWAQFIGINATCWSYVNGAMFFAGTDGSGNVGVFRWDTGGSDNGTAIQCDMQTAFSAFGSPGRLKNFTMIRPILRASASLQPALDVLVDYSTQPPANIADATSGATGGAIWGQSLWGVGRWASPRPLQLNWTSASGIGYVGSARMRVISNPSIASGVYPELQFQVIGFDLIWTPGGMI